STNTATGSVFLAQSPEVFGYDADGNQTNDGRWKFIWDAENRLISMVGSNVIDAAKRKVDFVYDSRGRRVRKTTFTWNSGWKTNTAVKFLYDDWNLVAEVNATNNSLIRSFMWGVDLSGSVQGAGGAGGLLGVNGTGSGVHFAAYDANGNVSALVA